MKPRDPFTDEERQAWDTVALAATLVLHLPRQHPNEQAEAAEMFHRIQDYLMSRPTVRDLEAFRPGTMTLTRAAELVLGEDDPRSLPGRGGGNDND